MSRAAPIVCLITPGHLASTPRLVKNADALAEAGYDVHVIAGRHFPPADALDAAILRRAAWRATVVDHRRGPWALAAGLRRQMARARMLRPGAGVLSAALAHQPRIPRLAAAAARVRAQFYFGHCLAGLPAAALAARRTGAGYGFDAEDYHDAETEEAASDPAERTARQVLQRSLLPGCRIFTAASPLIAEHYRAKYGARALPILNVFPLCQAPAEAPEPAPPGPGRPARLYWFSQTVGPGRGLEGMAAVAARMRTPAELHLRGFESGGWAARLGASGARIVLLPPAPPDEMARLAAPADLGLSLEESRPLNRDLCLTNKIFLYLLAGIPQLLTPTRAQAALAPELGAAGILADISRTEEAARRLDEFFARADRISEARRAARELARRRFCWDREKERWLEAVTAVLPL